MKLGMIALFWGIISAVSLPLGALIGLAAKPGRKITSALMAFGAGALLFALTIELFSNALHHAEEVGKGVILAVVAGAVVGGVLFDFLNRQLNNHGAFLRRFTIAKKYVGKMKQKLAQNTLKQLSSVKLLNSLPADIIAQLIPNMKKETIPAEQVIFREGELGDTLYFIISGDVDITKQDKKIAVLSDNDTFGEMALVTNRPRSATATTLKETKVFKIFKSDFDNLLAISSRLRETTQNLVNTRIDNLAKTNELDRDDIDRWKHEGLRHLRTMSIHVSDDEVQEVSHEVSQKKNVAVAIWLGILIDGVPESLVIGMLATSVVGISLPFIAGVFMANLPEAMSSAVGMAKGGMKYSRIFLMWASLCIITGIGAFLGTLFPAHPTGMLFYFISSIEGIAAGAMLTAIAESMLPEAFEQGGSIVGLATLSGFLVSLLIKII